MKADVPPEENFILSLGLTVVCFVADAEIQKNVYALVMEALVISNNNLFCIFEILRALENPGKCLSGTKDALLYITKRQLSVLLVH